MVRSQRAAEWLALLATYYSLLTSHYSLPTPHYLHFDGRALELLEHGLVLSADEAHLEWMEREEDEAHANALGSNDTR